jgi:hypothetical protein
MSHILRIIVIRIILYNLAPPNRTIDRALEAYCEITVILIGILTLLKPIHC